MFDFEFDMSVIEDTPLKSVADTTKTIIIKGYSVVISTEEGELSFNTYLGEPSEDTFISFYDAHAMFDMNDMITIKQGLLDMIEQHFYYGSKDTFLFYAPSCPRRDKIYMWGLKKLGYIIEKINGIDSYLILNK